jgi:hypothetical protein
MRQHVAFEGRQDFLEGARRERQRALEETVQLVYSSGWEDRLRGRLVEIYSQALDEVMPGAAKLFQIHRDRLHVLFGCGRGRCCRRVQQL